jgi:hypothetical protein
MPKIKKHYDPTVELFSPVDFTPLTEALRAVPPLAEREVETDRKRFIRACERPSFIDRAALETLRGRYSVPRTSLFANQVSNEKHMLYYVVCALLEHARAQDEINSGRTPEREYTRCREYILTATQYCHQLAKEKEHA